MARSLLDAMVVTPPEQQANFVERFLYLPDCYLPSDRLRPIGATPSRAQCGLPEDAFFADSFTYAAESESRTG